MWTAALWAGAAGLAADLYVAAPLSRHLPLPVIAEALLVAGVFGAVYLAAGYVLRVPEVTATIGRFIKR
jgi:hypothetical protein